MGAKSDRPRIWSHWSFYSIDGGPITKLVGHDWVHYFVYREICDILHLPQSTFGVGDPMGLCIVPVLREGGVYDELRVTIGHEALFRLFQLSNSPHKDALLRWIREQAPHPLFEVQDGSKALVVSEATGTGGACTNVPIQAAAAEATAVGMGNKNIRETRKPKVTQARGKVIPHPNLRQGDRKTGHYGIPEMSRIEILEMALEAEKKALELRRKVEAQAQKIEADRPKVAYYDEAMSMTGLHTWSEAALLLGVMVPSLRNALLRSRILRGENQPYKAYVDRGYFAFRILYGDPVSSLFITDKGVAWMRKKIKRGDLFVMRMPGSQKEEVLKNHQGRQGQRRLAGM